MYSVGIDYHKRYSHVTAVDERGGIALSRRLQNEPGEFERFFTELDGSVKVVLEASRTWGTLFDMLEGIAGVERICLAHPAKVRMIAEAKVKTDKIDAETLAQLLRADLIPESYIPPKASRLKKEILRQRMFLVRMRTRVKNRIHVLVDRLHLPLPRVSDLFGKRGTQYLKALQLEGIDGELLREDLALLDQLNGLLRDAEAQIKTVLGEDRRVYLIQGMPGCGLILSAVIAMEIDTIERFARPEKLAAYAGLVPTTSASGGKTYHGHLIKMSNAWLRWAFVEAAWGAIRTSPYCRALYERIKYRRGAPTAAVAVARRLAEITWHVLKEDRPYEERPARKRRFVQRNTDPAALSAA